MISACLIGVHCRYDGGHSKCPGLVNYIASAPFIPFCPEQLGGLSTPRPPANITGGDGLDILAGKARLVNARGVDVTDAFKKGAQEAYTLAKISGSPVAIMKNRSPSCGLMTPYCEKESGLGVGVTAAFFQSHGIRIFELDKDEAFPCGDFFELFNELLNP
jgi:uncharacterized protein YbbK (DUF523 family)